MIAYIGAIAAILNIFATLIGGVMFIGRLEGKINVQNVQIKALAESNKLLQTVVTSSAVTDQKIVHLQGEIDDLKRGKGYIQERVATGPRAVDREY